MAASNTGSNQSFDTLLRLLPGLVASYPAFMSILGDQGVDKSQLNQLTAALPQILEKLRQAEPEKLEALVAEITQAVPGLEDVLPKQEGRKRG
jgi:uncharacterized damage-inducible protein DinB